jgi:hypothetical protein
MPYYLIEFIIFEDRNNLFFTMKKILLPILFVFFVTTSIAREIDKKTASRVAKNFYYERVSQYKSIGYNDIMAEEILEITTNGRCLLYAVNINKGGFVLVSASEGTRPVAGYAFQGRFNAHGMPPQLADLLEQYKLQIAFSLEQMETSSPQLVAMWDRLTAKEPEMLRPLKNEKDLEPMLTTQWDQGKYYNEMCPADPAGPGGHCYAGCVATALGQVVNYFRWPLTGTGSYTYSCPPYGTLTADYENTTYEWDKMGTALSRSNLAIALLLHHLGIACDMVYGPDGSGMYNHKAAYALRTFFKYSPETQYVYRDSTTMDWDSLIISHLDRKIPLYYAGWSVPNINGHAFVCDGYQADNYYHFNWGWSGSYDGYFYTDNLSPGGSNFNLAQELIINAFPDTVSYDYPYYCEGDKILTNLDGTIGDGSGPVYDYIPGASCTWLIAPEDSVDHITIDFLNFNTESGDELVVYDGMNASAPVLGTYQGPTVPSSISSSGDKLFISFTSSGEAPGFLLSYEGEEPVYCTGATTLSDQSGTITDGSGPRDYHNGTVCIWMIYPEGANEVTIYFTDFHTEQDHDLVQIYDPDTNEELAILSGDITPDPVTSPSGKIFMTFSSNGSVTAPGWEAYYESDLVSVGEKVVLDQLKLYPNPADQYVNVSWYSSTRGSIQITTSDVNGKLLNSNIVAAEKGINQHRLDVSDLPKGFYFVKLTTDNQIIQHKLLISE